MSLRVFHIVFIVASIILSAFVSIWGFRQFAFEGQGGSLALGVLFLLFGAALVVYGLKAFRKLRELNHDNVAPFVRH